MQAAEREKSAGCGSCRQIKTDLSGVPDVSSIEPLNGRRKTGSMPQSRPAAKYQGIVCRPAWPEVASSPSRSWRAVRSSN